MSEVEKAVYLFKKGFSSSQAILSTYGVKYGIGRDTALKLASPFGSGTSGLNDICGAVSGVIMVLGLKYGNSKTSEYGKIEKLNEIIKEFIENFKDLNETIKCEELIGYNLDTKEGKNKAIKENRFGTICPKLVKDAAKILEEILNE